MILIRNIKSFIKRKSFLNKSLRYIYGFLPFYIKLWFSRISENAYKNLEDENKVIFVHVPKAAGNGITKSLFNSKSSGHYFITKYQKDNKHKFNSYFKFSFVRNPWDRLASAYFYLQQGGIGIYDKEFSEKYLSNITSFREFVFKLKDTKFRNNILKWTHFIPQYKFLCNQDGQIDVDYLGRFETLDKDFQQIKLRVNKPNAVLKKHNASNHRPYWEYYDEEMVEIVREVYKKDIELFGYEFPYEKLKKVEKKND